MKRSMITAAAGMLLSASFVTLAAQVRDWHDLDLVHQHVLDSIKEMEHAAAANHYDMSGHARKAESLLHSAETELNAAIDSAKNGH